MKSANYFLARMFRPAHCATLISSFGFTSPSSTHHSHSFVCCTSLDCTPLQFLQLPASLPRYVSFSYFIFAPLTSFPCNLSFFPLHHIPFIPHWQPFRSLCLCTVHVASRQLPGRSAACARSCSLSPTQHLTEEIITFRFFPFALQRTMHVGIFVISSFHPNTKECKRNMPLQYFFCSSPNHHAYISSIYNTPHILQTCLPVPPVTASVPDPLTCIPCQHGQKSMPYIITLPGAYDWLMS